MVLVLPLLLQLVLLAAVHVAALRILGLDMWLNLVQGRVLPASLGFESGELESCPERTRELWRGK